MKGNALCKGVRISVILPSINTEYAWRRTPEFKILTTTRKGPLTPFVEQEQPEKGQRWISIIFIIFIIISSILNTFREYKMHGTIRKIYVIVKV